MRALCTCNARFWWVAAIGAFFLLVLHAPAAKAEGCDDERLFQQGGFAAQRQCYLKEQGKQSKPLRNKACSEKNCLYRLSYSGKRKTSEGYEITIWSGSGYKLIEDMTKTHVEGLESGARIIDPKGRTTIMGRCGGTACYAGYEYVRGPLVGADLSLVDPPNGRAAYLLKIPRN